MKLFVASVIIVASFSVAALAQNAPPTNVPPQRFVPFTIEEQDAKNLRAYLDDQPLKLGLPILQWLEMLENRAKATAEAKAAEEAKVAAKPRPVEPKPEEKPEK